MHRGIVQSVTVELCWKYVRFSEDNYTEMQLVVSCKQGRSARTRRKSTKMFIFRNSQGNVLVHWGLGMVGELQSLDYFTT